MITCLPKPGKNREFIKNWRPISLLNIDYKILAGVIAKRVQKYLDLLISNSQKGFVSGRYIGECTRTVSDLISKLKSRRMSGILLLIDFEKAFDSLEWNFINKTLRYFNFGDNIMKWVNIFYKDIESCILNNGHCSQRFRLERGVRQGDPLSPYLFLLATEILARAITNDKNIKGIEFDNSEILISQLADDTTLFLQNNELSFRSCMKLLDDFANISGLKINYNKTIAIKIGLGEEITYNLGDETNITWQTEGIFSLLGIKYNLNEDDFTKVNYEEKIKDFKKVLNVWTGRKLTIYGKICIIKYLALPKLIHLFSSIPDPTEDIFKQLEVICFNFIWNDKVDKIKRSTMYNSYDKGGFRMIDFKLFCKAQKLIWVKKLLDDSNYSDWKIIFLADVEKYGGNYIWLTQNNKPTFLNGINLFWKDVFKSWADLTKNDVKIVPESEPLYHNDSIKIDNKTIFYNDWLIRGIRYLNDLINETGALMTWDEFSQKYDIQNQAFKYITVTHAIPKNWKKRIKAQGKKDIEVTFPNIRLIKHLKKPAKYFYQKCIETVATRPTKSEEKWCDITNIQDKDWEYIYKLPFKATNETKLREFQTKILHRILPTNTWLFKCNLVNSKNCGFCQIYTETLEHLFWECHITKNIWLRLGDWLRNLEITILPITLKNTLLGDESEKSSVTHIKMITKNYIYLSKINGNIPSFNQLLQVIKYKISIEKIYMTNTVYNQKWENNIQIFFRLNE